MSFFHFFSASALFLAFSIFTPAKAQVDSKTNTLGQSLHEIEIYSQDGSILSFSEAPFTDLLPSDWAYQALKNLVTSYGCVSGFPDSLFKGNISISRFDAAALLNACLDHIGQGTDETKALVRLFEAELAVLKGKVDSLQSRVGELEVTSFTATTTLRVDMGWLLGGTSYTGAGADAVSSGKRNPYLPNAYNGINNGPGFPTDGLNFVYASRFNLNTSFTGKDLLKIRMEVGNMTNSPFGINTATPLTLYAWFFPKGQGDNQMVLQRLNYTLPVSDKLTVTAGPIVRQDEMLGAWPVRYPTNAPLFGIPWYAGAPAAYNLNQGAGGSVTYKDKLFDSTLLATVMYISRWGDNGSPGSGGIGNPSSGAITTAQLALSRPKWTVAGIYTYSQDSYASANSQGTPAYYSIAISNSMHSYGLAGFYDFNAEAPWIPTLNLGAGYNQHKNNVSSRSASWWFGMMRFSRTTRLDFLQVSLHLLSAINLEPLMTAIIL
jgi:hypothetical protein